MKDSLRMEMARYKDKRKKWNEYGRSISP
jgi:hypothetical protein